MARWEKALAVEMATACVDLADVSAILHLARTTDEEQFGKELPKLLRALALKEGEK